MMAGTSACRTMPERGTCHPAYALWALATRGWWATKPEASSSAPSRDGTRSSTQAAPRPHAWATTSPSAALAFSCRVAGPSGVGRPSHQPCPRSAWNVGSPPPRRKMLRIAPRDTGRPGRQTRTSAGRSESGDWTGGDMQTV